MNEQQYRERAKKLWERDGVIEFDRDAVVSMGDDIGAYVQAWVWVDAEVMADETDEYPCPLCTRCGESIGPDESSIEDDGGEAHSRCMEDAEDAANPDEPEDDPFFLEHAAEEKEGPDGEPGSCVTCGTQCIADGSLAVICPKCAALEKAADLQEQYWDALGELERELGIELDNANDMELSGCTVTELLKEFGAEADEEDLEDVPSPVDDNEPDEDEPL